MDCTTWNHFWWFFFEFEDRGCLKKKKKSWRHSKNFNTNKNNEKRQIKTLKTCGCFIVSLAQSEPDVDDGWNGQQNTRWGGSEKRNYLLHSWDVYCKYMNVNMVHIWLISPALFLNINMWLPVSSRFSVMWLTLSFCILRQHIVRATLALSTFSVRKCCSCNLENTNI